MTPDVTEISMVLHMILSYVLTICSKGKTLYLDLISFIFIIYDNHVITMYWTACHHTQPATSQWSISVLWMPRVCAIVTHIYGPVCLIATRHVDPNSMYMMVWVYVNMLHLNLWHPNQNAVNQCRISNSWKRSVCTSLPNLLHPKGGFSCTLFFKAFLVHGPCFSRCACSSVMKWTTVGRLLGVILICNTQVWSWKNKIALCFDVLFNNHGYWPM